MGIIAVDCSALIAIVKDEADADTMMAYLIDNDSFISPINYVEACNIARPHLSIDKLDALLNRLAIRIAATDERQARLARDAYHRFGKGRHPAALNLGDCFAYALAMAMNAPLLYKGEDFAKTDVADALKDG